MQPHISQNSWSVRGHSVRHCLHPHRLYALSLVDVSYIWRATRWVIQRDMHNTLIVSYYKCLHLYHTRYTICCGHKFSILGTFTWVYICDFDVISSLWDYKSYVCGVHFFCDYLRNTNNAKIGTVQTVLRS